MSLRATKGRVIRRKSGWPYFLPSLLGLALFYLLPLLLSLSYALLDNMGSRRFVGLQHFAATIGNQMFRQGLYNTALLLAIGMPLLFALALAIALRVQTLRRGRGVILALLLLPLMVPAAVTSHFWQSTFAVNGLINRVLYDLNLSLLNFASSRWALLVPLLIYLWKHIGMAVLLFYTGLQRIPRQYYEQAACSGANQGQQLRRVTWPYLAPTSLVVFILSFIGILQVFKELYLIYGNYPPRRLYLLQHYLHNQFFSFNMQRLTAAAYILIPAFGLAAAGLFLWQKKLADTFSSLQLGPTSLAPTPAIPGSQRLPVGLILLLVLTLLPLVLTCSNSLMSSREITARYPAAQVRGQEPSFISLGLLPTEPTLQQYANLISANPAYWRSYRNSLTIALPAVLGQCVVSCLAAYAFHRSRWHHKELLFFGYIFLMLLPAVLLFFAALAAGNRLERRDESWQSYWVSPICYSVCPSPFPEGKSNGWPSVEP